jgi:hypothetical protein
LHKLDVPAHDRAHRGRGTAAKNQLKVDALLFAEACVLGDEQRSAGKSGVAVKDCYLFGAEPHRHCKKQGGKNPDNEMSHGDPLVNNFGSRSPVRETLLIIEICPERAKQVEGGKKVLSACAWSYTFSSRQQIRLQNQSNAGIMNPSLHVRFPCEPMLKQAK